MKRECEPKDCIKCKSTKVCLRIYDGDKVIRLTK